ncbi:hypothetical protein [Streptomyces sp. Isolate_219]|uniref:hypothetical protein n=1 Tax=Streptomyces sp. Isolate_219 TaxID=2950110 RepID=UPI0021C6A8FB|nr:hypothetical protein [Streptomyces sp. Isolate_219]MCR8576431.1 hypothetical protein [Streptomyces sp. Isolate_219]
MSDERRERYRTAIVKASYNSPLSSFAAEAVMAVADAELQSQNDALQQNIMAWRLRTGEAEQENARLRKELEQLRTRAAELEELVIVVGGHQAAAEEHEATIERVRAVSEKFPEAPWLHGPSIRAALEGDNRCGGCGEPRSDGVHGPNQGYGGCV